MALSSRKKNSIVLTTKPCVKMCVRKHSHITMAAVEVSWPIPMRAIGAQNLLTMPGGVSSSGYLHKKGGSQFSLRRWPLRYVILHKGCLYYFKSSTSATPQGAFSLNGYNRVMRAAEETTSSNVFPFKIIHLSKKHRTWLFSAASEDERRKWMRNLRKEIDYYNDRTDSLIPSDPDSDTESFYGSIEQPMDINPVAHNPENDYMVEDEDDDEEEDDDYVKPDDSATSSGKPTAPPPSYPPPPVPRKNRPDSASSSLKPFPPPVPLPNRTITSPVVKISPPPYPPPMHTETPVSKVPPPPVPVPPRHSKPPPPPSFSPILTPPPPPSSSLKKQDLGRASSTLPAGGDQRNRIAVSLTSPATLPICNELKARMVLKDPTPPKPGYHGNNHPRSPVPTPQSRYPNHLPRPTPSLNTLPVPRNNLIKPLGGPKPPDKTRGSSTQRLPPEGQSFRSSIEEKPSVSPRNQPDSSRNQPDSSRNQPDSSRNQPDSSRTVEIQLPDSVFVDTTETGSVERMFKESCAIPPNGLYCIRNSGTKTSKVLVVWDVSINKARNYRLFQETSRVFLETDLTFPSLETLVEHYYHHPLPNHGSLCLQLPYGSTVLR